VGVARDAGHRSADLAGPSPHDLAAGGDPVTLDQIPLTGELFAEGRFLLPEVGVERELPVDHERRDEHDVRSPFTRKPAGEIECMSSRLGLEQRYEHQAAASGMRAE